VVIGLSSVTGGKVVFTPAGGGGTAGDSGVTVADWQGSAFVLSTATGKTEIVDNLVHLWIAAERLLGRPCDPLDAALIALMEGELA